MFGFKAYLYGAIALAGITLLIMGFRWFTGIQAEVGNLREANAEYSIQVNALELQKQSDAAVLEAYKKANQLQQAALELVDKQFSEIRDVREQQKRVLEGSRLGKLAAEKAQLIENLSNRATRDRFKEFEGIINEDF